MDREIENAFDRGYEAGQKDQCCGAAGPWIAVSERLPEEGIKVVVHNQKNIFSVAFLDDGEWWEDGHGLEINPPTHWAELHPPEAK